MKNPPSFKQLCMLGVRVDNVTHKDLRERLIEYMRSDRPHHIVTVNPEFIMAAKADEIFRNVLNASDLSVPDGMGLLFLARLKGFALRERVTGVDVAFELAAQAAEQGKALFLFGAGDGVAKRAARALQKKYAALKIAGAENEITDSGAQLSEHETVERIHASKAEALLIALGSPEQDLWIRRALPHLPHVRVAVGVGGTFDFLAGVLPRAPRFLRSIGLEWVWRLILQPRRLRRIARATLVFPWAVMTTPHAIDPHCS